MKTTEDSWSRGHPTFEAGPRSSPALPLPTGWFMLAYSEDLDAGDVLAIRRFNRELVLFRTMGGRLGLLDAFCPHLGAHLGHGGTVEGETLRCPFHAWAWEATGRCVDIPYAKRIPPSARAGSVEAVEHSGRIWAWFAADGSAPAFHVPEIAEETDPAWQLCRSDEYTIRTCLQEMAENQADVAHFYTVHGADMNSFEVEAKLEGPHLRLLTHSVRHTPGEAGGHVVESFSTGLGVSCIRFVFEERPIMAQVFCGTPIDPETVAVRLTYRIRRDATSEERAMATELAHFTAGQFENDIAIWEHKTYQATPLLCDGDATIGEFRRWCAQFYPA